MKRAYLQVSYELLHQLLKLPDDVKIIRVEDSRDTYGHSLILDCADIHLTTSTNPGIPTVIEGAVIPRVEYLLTQHSPTDVKGEFR